MDFVRHSHDGPQRRNVTMDQQAWPGERFEEHRTHLRAVAYRMLGSLSEADNAVQEAWVRLARSDPHRIENLGGWLTTVVGRVCLDMLRSRRLRTEQPLETRWHPPSGSHSCCTTCSPCPSTRSPRCWGGPRPPRGSWRAAPGAESRGRRSPTRNSRAASARQRHRGPGREPHERPPLGHRIHGRAGDDRRDRRSRRPRTPAPIRPDDPRAMTGGTGRRGR
jgi:hypothetical protein